jgi:hypothetical protein
VLRGLRFGPVLKMGGVRSRCGTADLQYSHEHFRSAFKKRFIQSAMGGLALGPFFLLLRDRPFLWPEFLQFLF